MNFLIRGDGSPELGLGHLNRCRVLAEALRERGVQAALLTRDCLAARTFLGASPAQYLKNGSNPDDWPEGDALIVDLYNYDPDFYRTLHMRFKKIAVFDDEISTIPEAISAVINPNVYASAHDYPDSFSTFAGVEYFALRSELLGKRRRQNAQRVFICFGGSDPEGQTLRLLKLVLSATGRNIDVVLGPGAAACQELENLSSDSRIRIYKGGSLPDGLGAILEDAAYGLCGAGTMLYELAHVGVPAAFLCLADNQIRVADAFSNKRCGLYLGRFDQVEDAELLKKIRWFDERHEFRDEAGLNASKLVDGLGSKRLAEGLILWASGQGRPREAKG